MATLALLSGALVLSAHAPAAYAANGVWASTSTSGGGTLWSSASNWNGLTIADGPGGIADFSTLNLGTAANPVVNLDTTRTIGQLLFGETSANTNTWLLANNGFDAYPYLLLSTVINMLAVLQAPIILMSQNRQSHKDRLRSEIDYQVNLKNELALNEILERLKALERDYLRQTSGEDGMAKSD